MKCSLVLLPLIETCESLVFAAITATAVLCFSHLLRPSKIKSAFENLRAPTLCLCVCSVCARAAPASSAAPAAGGGGGGEAASETAPAAKEPEPEEEEEDRGFDLFD